MQIAAQEFLGKIDEWFAEIEGDLALLEQAGCSTMRHKRLFAKLRRQVDATTKRSEYIKLDMRVPTGHGSPIGPPASCTRADDARLRHGESRYSDVRDS